MIVLYTALLLVLGTTSFLLRRRAASLERKYSKAVKETHALLKEPPQREGNSNRNDSYHTAKRHYQLGRLVERKERLEAKHYFWEGWAERVGRLTRGLRQWRGRKVPYVLGAIDITSLLTTLEHLGYGAYASPRALLDLVTTWLNA